MLAVSVDFLDSEACPKRSTNGLRLAPSSFESMRAPRGPVGLRLPVTFSGPDSDCTLLDLRVDKGRDFCFKPVSISTYVKAHASCPHM